MNKAERMRKQGNGIGGKASVLAIPQKGKPTVRKLGADLMGSARVQTDFQKREVSEECVVDRFQRLVVKDRFLYALSRTRRHVGLVGKAVVEQEILQRGTFLGGTTADHGKIFFLHFVLLHRRGELGGRDGGLGVDHHTAHASVQSVNDPNVALVFVGKKIGKAILVRRLLREQLRRLDRYPEVAILIKQFHGKISFQKFDDGRNCMSEKNQREELTEESLRALLGDAAEGFSVCVFDELDSTNTEAKRRAANGEQRAILIARSQSAGRGRMGRSFYSPENSGVYFSLLMPMESAMENGVFLTSAVSVAVMRAIRSLTGKQVGIKWVNDLFWQGRKVCGILCESVCLGEERSVVIGIGINVRSAEFPPELSTVAGSLSADDISLVALISAVCREIFDFLENPASPQWLEDYRRHSLVLGKAVRWIENGIAHEGIAEAIREDGALCVRDENGALSILRTGEISLRLTQ